MPRRSRPSDPETLRRQLVDLFNNFQQELLHDDLRKKVVGLIPAFHSLRNLGRSILTQDKSVGPRERILLYFRKYPKIIIDGGEIMVVSGIGEWARRIRELRVEFGWRIATGGSLGEMAKEEGIEPLRELGIEKIKSDQYVLLQEEQDREAAFRWNVANGIRKKKALSVQDRILEFFLQNVGKRVTNEELRYVANDPIEWARRTRELRTDHGWSVATKTTGLPYLNVGEYVLQSDRQEPPHDRNIPDPVRRAVLLRDHFACRDCGWHIEEWHPADPRFIELHHVLHHVHHGKPTEENLITLCNKCHDERHRIEG